MEKEIWKSVEECVVDWEHETQINPTTGEVFDFDGNRIDSHPEVTESKED